MGHNIRLNVALYSKLKDKFWGPVAQLARAPHLQCGGHGFDSHSVHHDVECCSAKIVDLSTIFAR